MKNGSLKGFVVGFVAATMVMGSCAVYAAGGNLSISAMLMNSYTMKLNGNDFVAKSSSGAVMAPISYNGSTYLPVRALAEALKVPVDWDANTQTVWIGGRKEAVQIREANQFDSWYSAIITTDTGKLTTPRKTYQWGITNDKPESILTFGFNLMPEKKYKKFTSDIYLDAGVEQDLVMEIRKDERTGQVIKSITLKPGETTQLDLDIAGVDKLWFIADATSGHGTLSQIVIGEPVYRNEP